MSFTRRIASAMSAPDMPRLVGTCEYSVNADFTRHWAHIASATPGRKNSRYRGSKPKPNMVGTPSFRVCAPAGNRQGGRLVETGDVDAVLHEAFGHPRARPGQRRAIDAFLAGSDVQVLLPTGGGKSLCYQ